MMQFVGCDSIETCRLISRCFEIHKVISCEHERISQTSCMMYPNYRLVPTKYAIHFAYGVKSNEVTSNRDTEASLFTPKTKSMSRCQDQKGRLF